MVPRLRIFLSSPGDVSQERLRAHLVIQKLARDYRRYFSIESFLWEYEPMLASQHFQDTIDPPSSFDIVLLVLWSRLGTPLPQKTDMREYCGIDGRAPVTGTEWEFEDALRANRERGGKGPPDLLAYRRMGGATASLDSAAERDEAIRQYEALEAFWQRWFANENQFLAGYHEYQGLDEFDRRLEADLSRLIQRHIRERHLDQASPVWLKGSPFRGLEAYDVADAPIFFGRDAEIRDGLTRLADAAERGDAFLLLSGPSGSGKSSLARAGLVPSLIASKAVADVGLWRRVVMRPGDAGGDPVLALARALVAGDPRAGEGLAELTGKHMTAEELATHLATGGDPAFLLTRTLRDLADVERTSAALLPHEQARLVLLIDQLEEIFTRAEIDSERRQMFARIVAALAGSGVVWVIATMRSDLSYRLDESKEVKELRDLAERGARLKLEAPDAAQLLEIIRQPAQAAGLAFETDPGSGLALDATLAKEAAASPGVLPLLSVVLDDLYDRDVASGKSGGALTVASYRALGGLHAAIGQRAESKLQSLQNSDPAAAAALPRLLRALVTVSAAGDAPTSRPLALATFADGSPERRLVEAMVAPDARLLTVEDRGKGAEVRLAHEALIENWPNARRIVAESANFLRVRDEVDAQCRKWEVGGRPAEFLLVRGLPLAEAENLINKFGAEVAPQVHAFVKASRNRARRLQQFVAAVAVFFFVLAVGAMGAGVLAYRAKQEAIAQNALAVAQKARAETDFAAAKKAVDDLISKFVDGLQDVKDIPAATVHHVLDNVKSTIDALARAEPGDEGLQISRMAMLDDFSRAYEKTGDSAAAKAAAEEEVTIGRQLVKDKPDNAMQGHLSIALWTLGGVLQRAGDPKGSLAALQESRAIDDQLLKAERNPVQVEVRAIELMSHTLLIGNALRAAGDDNAAAVAFKEAMAYGEEVQRHFQQDRKNAGASDQPLASAVEALTPEATRALFAPLYEMGSTFGNGGRNLAQQGNNRDALTAYEQAVKIFRALASKTDSRDARRALALNLLNVMHKKGMLDDLKGGVAPAEEAVAIFRDLARDKSNTEAQSELVTGLRELAAIKLRAGDQSGAKAAIDEDLAVSAQLAGSGSSAQIDAFVEEVSSMGDFLREQGKPDDALAFYRDALARARAMAANKPGNTDWQFGIAGIKEFSAIVLETQGKFDEALATCREALSSVEALLAVNPGNAEWKRNLQSIVGQIDQVAHDFESHGRPIDALLAKWTTVLGVRGAKVHNLWTDIARIHADLALASVAGNATDCDRLASFPFDPYRVSAGVELEAVDTQRAVTACSEAVTAHPDVPRLRYLRGRVSSRVGAIADEARDEAAANVGYAAAIADYKAAMVSGYPAAFNNMSYMFFRGRGVAKDADKAEALDFEVLNRIIHCCAVPVVRHLLAEGAKYNVADVHTVARSLLMWSAALGNDDAREALKGLVADGTLAAINIPPAAKFTDLPPWFGE